MWYKKELFFLNVWRPGCVNVGGRLRTSHRCLWRYSLTSISDTIGHKNFSFCEQTLHKGLIDASCSWLQSTRKNRGQTIFLRKLRAKIQFLGLLFPSLRNISSYNPHTILKNAQRVRLKKNMYLFLFTEAQSRPRRRGLPRALPRARICNKEHGTY